MLKPIEPIRANFESKKDDNKFEIYMKQMTKTNNSNNWYIHKYIFFRLTECYYINKLYFLETFTYSKFNVIKKCH